MSLAIIAFLVLAISLVGTLIATALLGMVDDKDPPYGNDYPKAGEAADR